MGRVYNFSAGPACLPEAVLKKASEQMLDYEGSGMSVMEMSHRSKVYQGIIDKAEADLRSLMNIPDNYKVLFLQGGASLQFAMVPLNLVGKNKRAYYINTGAWSKKAIKEAKRFLEVVVPASSEDKTFSYIPEITKDMFDKPADYVHITYNNTIYGTHFNELPDFGGLDIATDMSSCILSEEIDVSKFGVIYAGAQKNLAPAGVTIVIARKDLIENPRPECPTMLKWKTQAENGSLYNTPPCFSIYMANLVLRHLKKLGGVKEINKINEYKAGLLYDFIDNSSFYSNGVVKKDRSIMNVPFVTPSKDTDEKFVKEAKAAGLVSLKGHRLVGGMRASIYNAMPLEGVKALIEFMKKFESENK